jgi:hypothetical protein
VSDLAQGGTQAGHRVAPAATTLKQHRHGC